MDIEFDPAKARSNLARHKVSFADAEQALRDPLAVTIEDPDAEGEQRFVAGHRCSWTGAGRCPHTARKPNPAHLCTQGQSRRNGAIPCVRNTISARASAARSSRRPEKRASRSCLTMMSLSSFAHAPRRLVWDTKP